MVNGQSKARISRYSQRRSTTTKHGPLQLQRWPSSLEAKPSVIRRSWVNFRPVASKTSSWTRASLAREAAIEARQGKIFEQTRHS
jgi:hypothetical protein